MARSARLFAAGRACKSLPLCLVCLAGCSSHYPSRSPEPYQYIGPHAGAIHAASEATGVPERILVGVMMAESSGRHLAVSPDGLDHGLFQLRVLYHDERAKRWGPFDPFDPGESALIAARIIAADRAALGDWRLAVAAYKQGRSGVKRGLTPATLRYLTKIGL
jgi:hypothetical protein